MLEKLISLYLSFFANPTVWGIGLAIVFGAIWIAAYLPPLIKSPWLWAVLFGSAILAGIAISFIQAPLQHWTGQALSHFWSNEILTQWLLLSVIPILLISALVQEGSKLVPMVIYWWRKGKDIDPKLGLSLGALAGAGLGIFETQWTLNNVFTLGWGWEMVQADGFMALIGFWERFFAIAFHVACSALAGYGLAKGKGWQFYLIVSAVHLVFNYVPFFFKLELLTVYQVEGFLTVWAILVSIVALWLRWKSEPEPAKHKKA